MYNSMNESHKVQWKKPDTKGYTLYDSFYINYKNKKDSSMCQKIIGYEGCEDVSNLPEVPWLVRVGAGLLTLPASLQISVLATILCCFPQN